jgi:hypothetical protein
VKEENPEAKITQLTKIISQMWNNADAEVKNRLEAEYQKNKIQVAKEKSLYEAKYGKISKRDRKKKIRKNTKQKEESW